MSEPLKEKYGLFTAIAMVVGIVMGSGVFFKAEKILSATGGNLPLGILAWAIGGLIMVACAYVFSVMAGKYSYVNGVVDYAEVALGKKYGYMVGWFMSTIYYPTLAGVLSWISARYVCVLFGLNTQGQAAMVLSMIFLLGSYTVNSLAPMLAGKIQVAATVIKIIPLILMAVVGTIVGLSNGLMVENFTTVVETVPTGKALFTAVVAAAFAYEGWIIATSINAELKNAKRNLPLALTAGTLMIVAIYILYYIGLSGGVSNAVMMEGGEEGIRVAFEAVFTKAGSTALFVFIIISCLGTLNGLMLACVRGVYSLAVRGQGPAPDIFARVDEVTDVPVNSGVIGLLLSGFWLFFFYGANLPNPWFGPFSFDSSEMPVITLYAFYIPIFIRLMQNKELGVFKRFIAPAAAICGSVFMIVAACAAHRSAVIAYLLVFAVIMIIGLILENPSRSHQKG